MIAILHEDGREETRQSITFEEIQGVVGGYVELVHLRDGTQGCCNEDGRSMGQTHNKNATTRLRGQVAGDCVGPWVFLSGKDLLR